MTKDIEDLGLDSKESVTVSQKVGCGRIYLIIELKDKKFNKLTIKGSMAKSCDCGESFLQALGRVLTFSIRRAIKEDDDTLEYGVLNQLQGHRCVYPIYRGALSCVDGIAKALKNELEREKKQSAK